MEWNKPGPACFSTTNLRSCHPLDFPQLPVQQSPNISLPTNNVQADVLVIPQRMIAD